MADPFMKQSRMQRSLWPPQRKEVISSLNWEGCLRYWEWIGKTKYGQYDRTISCHNIVGRTINEWEVIEQLPKADSRKGETGGNFSICYIVKNNERKAFMKVFDLERLPLPLILSRTDCIQNETITFDYGKAASGIVEIEAYQKSAYPFLNRHLPKDLQIVPGNKHTEFGLYMPYLLNTFQKSLKEIEEDIPIKGIKE